MVGSGGASRNHSAVRARQPSAITGTAATVALALVRSTVRRTIWPGTSTTSIGVAGSSPVPNSWLASISMRSGPGGKAAKRNCPSGALTSPDSTPVRNASFASSGAPSSRTITSRPAACGASSSVVSRSATTGVIADQLRGPRAMAHDTEAGTETAKRPSLSVTAAAVP